VLNGLRLGLFTMIWVGIISDAFDRWIAFGIVYDDLGLGLFLMYLIDGLRFGLFTTDWVWDYF
jgi:hypothetical protein